MLLAYVDESYLGDYYWIAAVVCPEEEARPLTGALDAAVSSVALSNTGIGGGAELHGHALFHGKDDWAALKAMPRARIGVYAAALMPWHQGTSRFSSAASMFAG